MASFKLTVKEREPADVVDPTALELPLQTSDAAATDGAQFLPLQCQDNVPGSPGRYGSSSTEEEPGPLSPLGS